jgi:hypothetical protein
MKNLTIFIRCAALLICALVIFAGAEVSHAAPFGTPKNINCNMTRTQLQRSGTPSITVGTSQIFIGYRQVSSINKNPILIRFNGTTRVFCRVGYETTGDDGTGYGLWWDGGPVIYGVFSATGTQGLPSQDFRRFATNGWLKSYGSGGGPKIAIIARINASTGVISHATFLSARLSSGKSNSIQVTGLNFVNGEVQVTANSWFSPRRTNLTAFTCTGSSPFLYNIVFNSTLTTALSATVPPQTGKSCS